MTDRQFQIEFERRLQLMDPELVRTNKLNSDTIFSFINEAIDKFYKTRYQQFEQFQKRIDDLRTLVRTKTYTSDMTYQNNEYSVILPEDYVIFLGDKVGISPLPGETNDCWEVDEYDQYVVKYGDTIEASVETLDRQLNNSLSEHLLKYCTARPLRITQGNEIHLYTDGNYHINEYTVTYLSKPKYFDSKEIKNEPYTSLPEHTHMEIVKMAVQLYLATKPMQHYSVYSAEVQTME